MEKDISSLQTPAIVLSKNFSVDSTRNRLAIAFSICFISTLFSGVVSLLFSVYLPVAVKDLLGSVSEEKFNNVSAVINSLFIFGWMVGGIIWGIVCDKIGRSKAVVFSTACYGLFALITAVSPNWLLVSVSRFMSGFGIGGVLVTTTILISEIWPEKKRAVALGFLAIGIPVGFFMAGAINNLLTDWRQAFLVGLIPLLLSVIAFFILKESERWKENEQILRQKQKFNKQIFTGVYGKSLFSGAVIFGAMLIGLWAIFSWAPTWVQSIAVTDAQQFRGLTVMILAGGGLMGSIFSGWIVNAIGLRKTMMMCFAGCFIMSVILFWFTHAISAITFVEIAVLAFFFGISQGTLAVYIPLLFPVNIRAFATGFCFNAGRLFTGTVVFFIGALETFFGGYGNAVFAFSFIFLIGLAATYFSKEKTVSN